MSKRIIDHIVYSVLDLDKAIDELEDQLGVRPVLGGFHKTQGTKNALLNLGNGCYLEVLAVDKQNISITSPRWMGVDLITRSCITRWALKSKDIDLDSRIVMAYNDQMGTIYQGSRKTTVGETLAWKMILPLPMPKIELIPFMVDWSESTFHPTDKLQEGCLLTNITLGGNAPDIQNQLFNELDISNTISNSNNTEISITIEGPKGLFILK